MRKGNAEGKRNSSSLDFFRSELDAFPTVSFSVKQKIFFLVKYKFLGSDWVADCDIRSIHSYWLLKYVTKKKITFLCACGQTFLTPQSLGSYRESTACRFWSFIENIPAPILKKALFVCTSPTLKVLKRLVLGRSLPLWDSGYGSITCSCCNPWSSKTVLWTRPSANLGKCNLHVHTSTVPHPWRLSR